MTDGLTFNSKVPHFEGKTPGKAPVTAAVRLQEATTGGDCAWLGENPLKHLLAMGGQMLPQTQDVQREKSKSEGQVMAWQVCGGDVW